MSLPKYTDKLELKHFKSTEILIKCIVTSGRALHLS